MRRYGSFVAFNLIFPTASQDAALWEIRGQALPGCLPGGGGSCSHKAEPSMQVSGGSQGNDSLQISLASAQSWLSANTLMDFPLPAGSRGEAINKADASGGSHC